jgi:hemoglobin
VASGRRRTPSFGTSGLAGDARLREGVSSCIASGTEIAMVNSNATSDDELHPQREVPRWHW